MSVTHDNPAISMADGLSLTDAVKQSFDEALKLRGKLNEFVLSIEGMSGRKYRYFINNLIASIDNARYLEVGSWAGSTLCSALYGNKVKATAIDNWSQFGGPVNHFFANVANCVSADARLSVLSEDFRKVNYAGLGKFNIYLFDGPHEYKDQYDGLSLVMDALTDEFVFIVDDWNWQPVRDGTFDAIRACGLEIKTRIEVRTTDDESHPDIFGKASDWHNGYFISVLRKRA
ncbi:class I SAM-dependent methyltransferase [Niveispirillum sp.]|uniref:class I SAM-dependent methyltransferase n=1 Tax=Niveispirillum sp. TaxID=1917217 RepID=UPI001B4CCDEF|nr:class I SAM-dependent methyltransferase [Niveispirillum sp.]MBP7335737.1 class I SAM-dependent methyltransferase [Niveispirillum sp.]